MDSQSRPPRRPGGASGFGNQNARRATKSREPNMSPSQVSSSATSSPSLRDDDGDHEDAMDVDSIPQSTQATSASSSLAAAPKLPVRTPSLSPPTNGSGNRVSNKTLSAASALAASLTPTARALLDGFSKLASPKPSTSPRILPNCAPLPTLAASALGAFTSDSASFTPGLSSSSSLAGGLDEVELDLTTLPSDSLVHAAIEARLPITAMSDLEFRTFGKHFGSATEKLATYLDVRNRILRAFFLSPQRALTLHEAIRACRDHRLDLVGAVYQFLVRNSMINFGVVRPPGISGGVLVSPSMSAAASATAQAADGGPSTPPTSTLPRARRFVVIGAGAAGLACARQLKQIVEAIAYSATLDPSSQTAHVARTIPPPEIIVLEARNRVGGRVYTHPLYTKVRTSQSPFASTYTTGVDLGAKVVTGFDGGNPIKTIVRGQLRLKTHELNGLTKMFDSHGDVVDSGLDEAVEEIFNEVLEETTRMREEMKAASKKARRPRGRGKGGKSTGNEMTGDGGGESDREQGRQSPVPREGRQSRRLSITTRSAAFEMSSSGAESSAASSRASSLRRTARRAVPSASVDSSSVNTSDQDSSTHRPASDASDNDSIVHQSSSDDDDDDDCHSTRSRSSTASNNPLPGSFLPLPKLFTMSLGDAIDMALNSHPQFQSFSSKETELLHWHLANLEFANSSTVDQNSLEHWDQDDEHELLGPHGMIIGGYGQVTHALAYGCRAMAVQTGTEADGIATDALDLRLNTPVTQIRWNKVHKSRLRRTSALQIDTSTEPSNAEVTCADGTRIAADAVIVTAPLGVLKSGSIQFSPELPKKMQTSIQRLGFGTLNKVVLVFKSAFWDTSVESFGVANPPDPVNPQEYSTTRGRNYLFWNMTDVVKLPVLVAMSAGHAAVRLESTPDTIIVQEALDALRKIYGPRNVPPPLETVVTRWSYDEYARGSYSYVATGSSGEDYDRLAAPLGNTVYFAGEHTCREYPATVHGAMLSGMRAAAEVANAMYGEVRYVEDDDVMEVVEPAPEGLNLDENGDHGGEPVGMGAGAAGAVVNSLFATLVNGMAGTSGSAVAIEEPMQLDVVAAPATKRKRGGNVHVPSTGTGSSSGLRDQAVAASTTDVDSTEDFDSGDAGVGDQLKRVAKKAKSNAPGSTKKAAATSKLVGLPASDTSVPAEDPAVWRIFPGRNWTRTNVTIPCTQYLSATSPCAVTCSTPTEFFEHILTHLTPADRLRYPGDPDERGEYPTLPRIYMPIPPKPPTKNPFMLFQLVSWEAMRRETPGNERHLIRQRMGERWRDLDLLTKQAFQAEVDRMQEKYAKAMDVFRLQCEALGLGEYRTHLEAQVPVDLEKLEESLSQVGTPVLQAATLFISSRMLASGSGQSMSTSTSTSGSAGMDGFGDDGSGLTSPSPLARMASTPPLKPGENPHARRDGLLAAGAAGVIPMPQFPPLPPMTKNSSPRPQSAYQPRPPPQRPASPSSASKQQQQQHLQRPPGVHTPARPAQPRTVSPKQPHIMPPIQPARAASTSSPKLPGPRTLFPPHPSTPSSSAFGAVPYLSNSSPHGPSASLLGSPSSGMPPSFALYQASSRLNRFESAGTSPPPPSASSASTRTPPPGVIAPGTIPTTSASHHNGGSIKSPADGIKTYLNTVVGDRQYQQYVQQRHAAAHGSPSSAAGVRSGSAAAVRNPAPAGPRGLPPAGNR